MLPLRTFFADAFGHLDNNRYANKCKQQLKSSESMNMIRSHFCNIHIKG
jgi:hypothetical protein